MLSSLPTGDMPPLFRPDPAPPAGFTGSDGLVALRALSGLVWSADALRIAETIAALPPSGAQVPLARGMLERLAIGMAPTARDDRGLVEVLVGMATVLALAGGNRAALTRPFLLQTGAEGLSLAVATLTEGEPS